MQCEQGDQKGIASRPSQTSIPSESSSVEERHSEKVISEDEDDDDDDLAGTRDLVRAAQREVTQRAKAERKAKRNVEKQEAARLAGKRRFKEVKQSRLSSISGGGGVSGNSVGRDMSKVECYQCGRKGHERRDCPQKTERQSRDGASRKRKTSGDVLGFENR